MNLNETLQLAEEVGRKLRGGEAIELVSDLGGGKTTFVRGIASGMGSKDVVSSPSFTLTNEYHSSALTLYHFDFYRLNEPGIMRDELTEVLQDPKAVVMVEWAQLIEDVLPPEHVTIHITPLSQQARSFEFTYPAKYQYLFTNNT